MSITYAFLSGRCTHFIKRFICSTLVEHGCPGIWWFLQDLKWSLPLCQHLVVIVVELIKTHKREDVFPALFLHLHTGTPAHYHQQLQRAVSGNEQSVLLSTISFYTLQQVSTPVHWNILIGYNVSYYWIDKHLTMSGCSLCIFPPHLSLERSTSTFCLCWADRSHQGFCCCWASAMCDWASSLIFSNWSLISTT